MFYLIGQWSRMINNDPFRMMEELHESIWELIAESIFYLIDQGSCM